MDVKAWTIIALSIQITLLSMGLTKTMYDLGYERGRIHVLTTFDETSEGTCFAKDGCPQGGTVNDPRRQNAKRH